MKKFVAALIVFALFAGFALGLGSYANFGHTAVVPEHEAQSAAPPVVLAKPAKVSDTIVRLYVANESGGYSVVPVPEPTGETPLPPIIAAVRMPNDRIEFRQWMPPVAAPEADKTALKE